MSIASVIAAAADLKDTNDQIEALQEEKTRLQDRVGEINQKLDALRDERSIRVATLKQEAGTI